MNESKADRARPAEAAESTLAGIAARHEAASDRLLACAIAVGCAALYMALRQANFPYNGAAFVVIYRDWGGGGHSHHLGFGWVFTPFLKLGRALGLDPNASGTLHSAVFMGASQAAFLLWLRRYGIGRVAATLHALLLGVNATALEIATSPEMFAASLFATMLALHAWKSLADRPGLPREAALFAALMFLLALHSGFAFWSLAIYATLAWRDRRRPARVAAWLASGAVQALALAVWMWFAGHLHPERHATEARFFSDFWRPATGWGIAARIPVAFLYEYSAFAGLILLPATFGVAVARRRFPDDARLFVAATLCFVGFFSFWIPHIGVFYLPLQPIWGLFAAIGFERALAAGESAGLPSSGRRRAFALAVAAFLYALVFLYPLQPANLDERFHPHADPSLALALVHLSLHAALAWIGFRMSRAPDDSVAAEATRSASVPRAFVAAAVLAVAAWVYSDRTLRLLDPDDLTLELAALDRAVPSDAIVVTSRLPFRPEAQTSRVCVWWPSLFDAPAVSLPNGFDTPLSALVRSLGREGAPPLILDRLAWTQRARIWREIPSLRDVPLDELVFEPIHEGEYVFRRVRFRDPRVGALHAAGLDPYPPSSASPFGAAGTPVPAAFTKATTRLPISWLRSSVAEPDALRLEYLIEHPDLSDDAPVSVAIRDPADGRLLATERHATRGPHAARIDRGSISSDEIEVVVDPPWIDDEGFVRGILALPSPAAFARGAKFPVDPRRPPAY